MRRVALRFEPALRGPQLQPGIRAQQMSIFLLDNVCRQCVISLNQSFPSCQIRASAIRTAKHIAANPLEHDFLGVQRMANT